MSHAWFYVKIKSRGLVEMHQAAKLNISAYSGYMQASI